MTATCTRGSVVTIRPLPSFVTRTTVPVSATAKLAPGIPMSACRHVPAEALHVLDELLEMAIEVLERRLLDRAGPVTKGIALGKLAERLAPELEELRGRDRQRLLEEAVLQRAPGAIAERGGQLAVH